MGVDYFIVKYEKEKGWTVIDYCCGNDHMDLPGPLVWDDDFDDFVSSGEMQTNEICIADTWEEFFDDNGDIVDSVCNEHVAKYPDAWGAFWKYQWLRDTPRESWPDFVG